MNLVERVIHDMKQYAFTRRKLEMSIMLGNHLEQVYPIMSSWNPFRMYKLWKLTKKLFLEMEFMSKQVSEKGGSFTLNSGNGSES